MSEATPPGEQTPEQARETERVSERDRVSRLLVTATELASDVEELARDSGHQFTSLARTARVNRLMIWGVIAGGCLDIFLTVIIGFLGVGMVENTDRIDTLTQQMNAENTDQRRRALCPLYGIFLDSKSDAGRDAAPDPEKYDHAFEVIEDGYLVLGCDKFLEQSGQNQW